MRGFYGLGQSLAAWKTAKRQEKQEEKAEIWRTICIAGSVFENRCWHLLGSGLAK